MPERKVDKIINGERIVVSSNGYIVGCSGKMLKPQKDKSGYCAVYIGGKRMLVHRIIAECFVDGFSKEKQVHHINENKADNRVENLMCMTMKEHQALHKTIYPKTKICEVCGKEFMPMPSKRKRAKTCSYECWRRIAEIRAEKRKRKIVQMDLQGNTIKVWDSGTEIEKETGYFGSNICKCCNGIIQTYKGYRWKYAS